MTYDFLFFNYLFAPKYDNYIFFDKLKFNNFELDDIIGFECAIRTKLFKRLFKRLNKSVLNYEDLNTIIQLRNEKNSSYVEYKKLLEEHIDCSNYSHNFVLEDFLDTIYVNKYRPYYKKHKYKIDRIIVRLGLEFEDTLKKILQIREYSLENIKKPKINQTTLFKYKNFTNIVNYEDIQAYTEISDELSNPEQTFTFLNIPNRYPKMYNNKKLLVNIEIDINQRLSRQKSLLEYIQSHYHNVIKNIETIETSTNIKPYKFKKTNISNISSIVTLFKYLFIYDYYNYSKYKQPMITDAEVYRLIYKLSHSDFNQVDSIKTNLSIIKKYIDNYYYHNLFN